MYHYQIFRGGHVPPLFIAFRKNLIVLSINQMKKLNSTAVQITAKIKVGINIGNSLEASGDETGWRNPLITNDLIKTIKQDGFNAVRLPSDLHH